MLSSQQPNPLLITKPTADEYLHPPLVQRPPRDTVRQPALGYLYLINLERLVVVGQGSSRAPYYYHTGEQMCSACISQRMPPTRCADGAPLEGNGGKGTGKEARQWPWSGLALIKPLNISIAEARRRWDLSPPAAFSQTHTSHAEQPPKDEPDMALQPRIGQGLAHGVWNQPYPNSTPPTKASRHASDVLESRAKGA